jgi:DNA-binding NtrC family response regulator
MDRRYGDSKDMRILIADHDVSMIAGVARALRHDCTVEVATSKAHCIDLLRRNAFQLVITCEHLSDGSGLELLTQIAQRSPDALRVFAAELYRLSALGARLQAFDLFETLTYPLAPGQVRALLAQAKQAEEVDTITVETLALEEEKVREPANDGARNNGTVVQRVNFVERRREAPEEQHIVLEGDTVRPAGANKVSRPVPLALEDDIKREPAGITLPLESRRPPTLKSTAPRGPSPAAPSSTDVSSQHRIIALTRDKNCLVTIVAALAGRSLSVTSMSDLQNALKILRNGEAAAMLIDLGAVGSDPIRFLVQACAAANGTRVLALGRTDDAPRVAELLSRGKLHRFVVKPVSRTSMRTAFESVLALSPAEGTKAPTSAPPFAALIDRVTAAEMRNPLPPPNEERASPKLRIKRSYIQFLGSAIAAIGAIILALRTLGS